MWHVWQVCCQSLLAAGRAAFSLVWSLALVAAASIARALPDLDATRRDPALQAIMSTYKFAFTPENSIDEGYVTEKVYAALRGGGPLRVASAC